MNFVDLVLHHALTKPHQPALVQPDRVITYAMLARQIAAVMARLRGFDLAPGSLVSVAIASPALHMIVAAAAARLGLTRVSVSQTATLTRLGLPVALYIEDSGKTLLPGLRQVVIEEDWFAAAPGPAEIPPRQGFAPDAAFIVTLSSGTTGRPKAIAVTETVFGERVRQYGVAVGATGWDRMLCLPGLSTSFGFTFAAYALYQGKTLIFAGNAGDALQMIAYYGIDCLACSTGTLQKLVMAQKQRGALLPSLRLVFTGGSLVSRTLLAESRATLTSGVTVLYGSTEVGVTAFAPADRLGGAEGMAGFAAPWAEMQMVDEADAPVPPGTNGILRIRSEAMGRLYPDENARSGTGFRDGWFYPGDIGRLSPEGLLVLTGRDSEIINAGGVKMAPDLIEEIVQRHPQVADAAAFAGTGKTGLEELWVAIVARAPTAAQEVARLLAARNFAPERVFVVPHIPRNQMGKIERDRLRRELAG